jgi:beta-ureidopropionase / N-carbamoyl-L-amino-acid hydrolase
MSANLHAALHVFDAAELLQQLDTLGRIGAGPDGGVNRLAFSPADQAGRAWIAEQMGTAGLAPVHDGAGNVIGRRPGKEPHLPPIVIGSHTDSVPNGGRFDGALGVLAACAVVRTLRDAGLTLRHALEVIDFAGEEATIPGGTFGSRAMAGLLPDALLAAPAWNDRPVAELLRTAGLDPTAIARVMRRPGELAAYLELHIEQGSILDTGGETIGVVEGIVGIRRYQASFVGRPNHAGTTPMADRQDALVLAAPFIGAVQKTAIAHAVVGTVGTVHIQPNAPNVIPGRVDLGLELRGLDGATLDAAARTLATLAASMGGTLSETSRKEPVLCDRRIIDAIEMSCARLGLTHRRLPSGAGHDAMCIAALAPVGMIFVPSTGGISHAPDEWTPPEDCISGALTLLATVLELDAQLN